MRVHKAAHSVQGFGSKPMQVNFLSPLQARVSPDVRQALVDSPSQQEETFPPTVIRSCSDAEPQSLVLNPKINQRGDPGNTSGHGHASVGDPGIYWSQRGCADS